MKAAAPPAVMPTTVPRDRYGRAMIEPPGGGPLVPYTRATTVASTLDETHNLAAWQRRMVLVGVKRAMDKGALDLSTIPDDHPDDDRAAKTALGREADRLMALGGAHDKRDRGTFVHSLTEARDRGTPGDEGEYAPLLDAYTETTSVFDGYHAIEQGVVLDEHTIHGTPDRLVYYGGEMFVADVKTGSTGFPMGMAIQLGIYANAGAAYDYETRTRSALPTLNRDRGIIVALNPDTGVCSLHWLDIAWGWEQVRLALAVRKARRQGGSALLRPLYPDPLAGAIKDAETTDALVALWTAHQAQWTAHHTQLAASRKAALTTPAA